MTREYGTAMRTIIRNGIVVTMNRNMDVWPDGYVMFEGTKILAAGPSCELEQAMAEHGLKREAAEHGGEAPELKREAAGHSEEACALKQAGAERGKDESGGTCLGGGGACAGVGGTCPGGGGACAGAGDTRRALDLPGMEPDFGFREIDARRAIIMPGMVNTHCHLGMIPFRGLGDDCKDRLRVFLLPMEERAMDRDLAAASSRYALAELLLGGVTTVMDMYYFEDEVARVMDEMGIRGIAGETVMEAVTCDARTPQEAISRGEAMIRAYSGHPRVKGCLAPHGTTTCSAATLQRVHEVDRAHNALFTLHVAEMDYEMDQLRERFGMTPVEYLHKLGVLDKNALCAHSIRMTDGDIGLLRGSGASVAHCIASNTKAAKGVAPVKAMRAAGVSVGLGTDGPASGNTLDLFTQMRMCANFHKNELRDRSAFPAAEIVKMATCEGAAALGLGGVTGSLEPGKEADIVLVETDSPNMFPVYDPYAALVYSACAANVRDVYVAGTCLVKDKRLTSADFGRIRGELSQKMERTAFQEMGNLLR